MFAAQAMNTIRVSRNCRVEAPKGHRILDPVLVRLGWKTSEGMPMEDVSIKPDESLERLEISAILRRAFAGREGLGQEGLLTAICNDLVEKAQTLVPRLDQADTLRTIRRMTTNHNVGNDVWFLTFVVHIKNRAIELGRLKRGDRKFYFVPETERRAYTESAASAQ